MKQQKGVPLKILVVIFLFVINYAKAQNLDSVKQNYAKIIAKKAGVDHDKALKIAELNMAYKDDVRDCVGNKSLSLQAKKEKLSQLLNEKNQKLKNLLTPQQMSEFTPGSHMVKNHHRSNTDSLNKKNINHSFPILNLDKNTSILVTQINENYKNGIKAIMSNQALSEKAKREKMDALSLTKRKELSKILTPEQLAIVSPGSNKRIIKADSLSRKNRASQISKLISTDERTGERVIQVMDDFNEVVTNISNDNHLSLQEKQLKSKQAIARKRTTLLSFLTLNQVNKLVPPENSAPAKGFSAADISKYPETAAVQDTFSYKMKLLLANKNLTEQERRNQIDQLIKERNTSLNKAYGKRIQLSSSTTN